MNRTVNKPAGSIGYRISIEELAVQTRVGLYAHEQEQAQQVMLDIDLTYRGGQQDDVDGAIDYDRYCGMLTTFLRDKPHARLLETLAAEVAVLSFDEFPMLEEIRVAIHKPKIRDNALRIGVSAGWTRWSYETLLAQPAEAEA